MIEKYKVLTYITRGSGLLVFRHPDSPESGIQVPGGTVEPGERVEDAALREAIEETGLASLRLSIYLGDMSRDMSDFGMDEIHHRHYFHVWCDEEPPATWQYYELNPHGSHQPILFDFYWVNLMDGVPALTANHAAYIPKLAAHLGL